MTSPSWPVSVRPASPGSGMDVASTNSTSPPAPVTARPVATPGTEVRSATSRKNRGRPSQRRTSSSPATTTGASTSPVDSAVAALRRSLPMARSSPRTPASRVWSADDGGDGVVGQVDLVGVQAVALELAGHQVVPCDVHLLGLGVAVQRHDLHAVEQGPRDGVGDVGGGDEQHVGEVQVHLQVVVPERVVLGRVQHLEQRGRRVAAPVVGQLVHLVQHEDRVHDARRR